ncbi:hypothetical protein [Janthinobacterium sp. 17J80-10]|uniref:hypothetical protein n=1 Tax=Janthinobacterium sp. 17J80-10 TaxID=2497863 RepID=UPI0010056C24|nr:hypothetical protein [Janthinobacterium sp. 17J80-10]QAU34072.1 hypothetical protein EKL02_07650 [Janthinobacterium sp. 17J80-10]
MDQAFADVSFVVERSSEDRRVAQHMAPPYLTDEGFILYDRREGGERRGCSQPADAAESRPSASPDLVSQRMEHLAALYGYASAQAQAQAEVARQVGSDWYRPLTRKSANGV